MRGGNLREGIPSGLSEELFTELVRGQDIRIERIVSRGHASPEGFWYDQDEAELVVVVQGAAEIEIDDHGIIALGAGDWVDIPPHVRHRVAWTTPDRDTIWIAAFYRPDPDAGGT